MDILVTKKTKTIPTKPLKATYDKLTPVHKLVMLVFFVAILNILFPHHIIASGPKIKSAGMVFPLGNFGDYITILKKQSETEEKKLQERARIEKHARLVLNVQKYLAAKGSPLSSYASDLIKLNNWKKIVALSNAESSMCRKYPVTTANCWGVGGSNLWDMGDNLGEGIVEMNKFLNSYPRNYRIKYSQMDFKQMNGLYKQPAANHWLYNNTIIYNELTNLEKNL